MVNFENVNEARKWLRELDEETTAEYGDYSVMEYSAPLYLGTVAQVLY